MEKGMQVSEDEIKELTLFVEFAAKVCHEANRAFCESIGDHTQKSWDDAPDWQIESAMNGVMFVMINDTTPEATHNNWLRKKEDDGWVYGEVKDADNKTHPCMVPYEQLPVEQKSKDYIFRAIVKAFQSEIV